MVNPMVSCIFFLAMGKNNPLSLDFLRFVSEKEN